MSETTVKVNHTKPAEALTLWAPQQAFTGRLSEVVRFTKNDKSGRETLSLLPRKSKDNPDMAAALSLSGAALNQAAISYEEMLNEWLFGELSKAVASGKIVFTKLGIGTTGRGAASFKPKTVRSISELPADSFEAEAKKRGFALVPQSEMDLTPAAPAKLTARIVKK